MDRLEMVELIEEQAAKLTPEGRDLAERMELLAEAPPGPDHRATYDAAQRAQADEAWDLSSSLDRSIIERLHVLWEGLERSDGAARRGKSGARYRDMAVVVAAGIKDRSEGRMIDPDMTPAKAVSRLREPG
jgi:hypothetical protein